MPPLDYKPKFQEIDHRKAILSLRCLASYLTLFSYIGTERFPMVFAAAAAFSLTNVLLTLIPRRYFLMKRVQQGIALLDFVFVSTTFYLLRNPETYLYLAFLAVFLLAVAWHDLRLVLFSLFAVSLLFGVFSYFRLFRFQTDVNIEQVLRLALFFLVSVFYIFSSERPAH